MFAVRINGSKAIYYNNKRIKARSFNAWKKREMVAPSASAAVPSASATPQSDLVTQLSASAVTFARVVSCLIETRRAGCAVRSVRQTDRRTNKRDVLPRGSIFLLLAAGEE
jgi:hypothetical protein